MPLAASHSQLTNGGADGHAHNGTDFIAHHITNYVTDMESY